MYYLILCKLDLTCNLFPAGQDFQVITNMYLGPFGSNNNHQCFNVSILDDTWSENSEEFMVNVQFCPGDQPERVDINPVTGTTAIIDDDGEL